ncbi:hypothetical protein [Aureispira anguillae]|uniref:Lipoprotein n=1 Tax=Aureispira anguillae TaxID=2864201 RepID=A0A915Y9V8_9BACT|nr:hypothetical protein [Aureispira anguillae]BDS09494.1 hypothetical protein AsAng_0001950 [Aureispira anguillae]
MSIKTCLFCLSFFLASCNQVTQLSVGDIKEVAVQHFREKGFYAIRDTADIHVKLIKTGLADEWYVAFNAVMSRPALFLYHISDPKEPPHYIPLTNKSEGIIEHVDFENVTNDEDYELVIDLHFDYGLAYQGREIVILRHPFGNPAYEIFSFPFEQVWESIDSFDNQYGLPQHSKRVENRSFYEFFEGYILIKGTVNYRDNHLLEYKWDRIHEEFLLILDEELHEVNEEEDKGGIVHKVKGNKILVEVNAHEEGCIAYLIEDAQGHVIEIPKKIHDELLCSQVTSLSPNGRYLIYTNLASNAICIYDIEQQKNKTILKDFNSYEGVSEVVWAPHKPIRFGFISVNQEEFLENTTIYIFSFDADGELYQKNYPIKVHYECDLEGICVPLKDYNYKFERNNLFVYTPDANGKFKGLPLYH